MKLKELVKELGQPKFNSKTYLYEQKAVRCGKFIHRIVGTGGGWQFASVPNLHELTEEWEIIKDFNDN